MLSPSFPLAGCRLIVAFASLVLIAISPVFAWQDSEHVQDSELPILKDPAKADSQPNADGLPTLYIMGDSTVRNGHLGGVGWGEVLDDFFLPDKIHVVNRAIGGRSTRSYTREKRWQSLFEQLKPGDFVLMQFGHNDGGRVGDQRFKRRPALPGTGDQTQEVTFKDGTTEIVHTYGWYLEQFCKGAKSKQAIPIICAPVPHQNNWQDGKFTPDFQEHRIWCRQVAEATGANFMDLTAIVGDRYQELGPSNVAELFADARTHTNRAGAVINARCVIAGLKAIGISSLAESYSAKADEIEPASKTQVLGGHSPQP